MADPINPLPVAFFNRDRRLLTRYQERRIRETFPFLDLPAELRNEVYVLCVHLDGVESYFDRCYAAALEHNRTKKTNKPFAAPDPKKTAPTILRVCKQTYFEAVGIVSKLHLNFHHGLFATFRIKTVISKSVLCRLNSITVDMNGHDIFKSKTASKSWRGYMDLIADLAMVLKYGHKLKGLTIDFNNKNLTHHLTKCWHSSIECDYRVHVKQAFNRLKAIRNVGNVTIKGLDPAYAAEIKAIMEGEQSAFLLLPGELRNKIYSYSLTSFTNISSTLADVMTRWTNHAAPMPYPRLHTPNLLLINHQIQDEASSLLRRQPLTLTFPTNIHINRQDEIPSLHRFISAPTLSTLNHIKIKIENWEWIYALPSLFTTLTAHHELETFTFAFHDKLKDSFLGPPSKVYPDESLSACLAPLSGIRGVEKVVFEGDLPAKYVEALVWNMSTKANVPWMMPQAIRSDGSMVGIAF